jgi:hypothetical protein
MFVFSDDAPSPSPLGVSCTQVLLIVALALGW